MTEQERQEMTWRERLVIFLTLKVIDWLAEGTRLHSADLAMIKNELRDSLEKRKNND